MRNIHPDVDKRLSHADRVLAMRDANANTMAVMEQTAREEWIGEDDQRRRVRPVPTSRFVSEVL